MKNTLFALGVLCLAHSASAVTFTFGAFVENGISDASGAEYDGVDLYLEFGTYEGAMFDLIDGGAFSVFDGVVAGFTVNSLNTTATGLDIAGDQLALKIYQTSTPTGDFSLFSYDKAVNPEWAVKSGDGTTLDFNSNTIDIGDLTTSGGTALDTVNSTVVDAVLGSTPNGGGLPGPNFVLGTVPEPSSFAMIAGIAVLGVTAVRRRR